ncbi:hypothetical protein EV426DRAFT_700129 [Tirmania nivea]|nr:hypothetical protein EV426DRAFT_700129 [Tirmania nivea]
MNSLANLPYSQTTQTSEIVPPQILGADPIDIIDAIDDVVPEFKVIEGNHEKPPDHQLIKPSYRAISTIRFALILSYIIAGNCLCSGSICLCLWGFSTINDLSPWEKRAFNASSLLLSAGLGFGIGFLLDRIGLLARGTLLQSKSHSMKEIAYIMMGTPSSYALLFMHQVRTRRGLVTPTTWVLFLYLLGSVFGRFGVAFLGFAVNLDDSAVYTPPLFRPNWANGTVDGDDSHDTDLASLTGYPVQSKTRALLSSHSGRLCEVAQAVKGLPWLQDEYLGTRTEYAWNYRGSHEILNATMNISYFENANFTMDVWDGNKVSFRYKFKDFRGTTAVLAGWEALLETSCRSLESTQNVSIPLGTINSTLYPRTERGLRWIHPKYKGPRQGIIQLWLTGRSSGELWDYTTTLDNYLRHKVLLFNCSVYFVDSPTHSRPLPSLDVYDEVPSTQDMTKSGAAPPIPHILGLNLHYFLRQSPALSTGTIHQTNYADETFRDFPPTQGFNYGVSQKNRSASELWLSAYIGNYIGNCLSLLNDFLQLVEIEPEAQGISTKLLVKWERVAAILGGLIGFQLLFGLAALLYCRQNFEMVDDVSTLLSMFTGFPLHSEEGRRQEGAVCQGKFVAEGDGFRWIFVAGAGKEVKVPYSGRDNRDMR